MISGIVLARNESINIAGCLTALRPHVSELILIDMESTDETIQLATPLVDRVLTHPLIPNFDSARNIAIGAAKNDWLWFIDADERVPTGTGHLVNQLVRESGPELTAITIPFKSYFAGKWIQHSGWWPGYTMPRVLRRGRFRFVERLHGGVAFEGAEMRIAAAPELAIEHFSYRNIEHYLDKFNRYTTVEAANLHSDGADLDWERGLRAMMRDLWLYYERNSGHLDGIHGWILAWLAGQYRWFSHSKLLPHVNEATTAIPANLDQVLNVLRDELARCRNLECTAKLPVHFRSPLLDPSGYADDGRNQLKAMLQTERNVFVENIPWSNVTCQLTESDATLLKLAFRLPAHAHSISLTNCIPTLCAPDPAARWNILRTTFETDRIPEGWLQLLAQYDEIWVCSQFNARVFRQSGVPAERIQVLPQCVDTSIFHPQGPTTELPVECRDRFVFLSIFDWQCRKGWDILVQEYCRAFAPTDGAVLLLKISRSHGISQDAVNSQLEAAINFTGFDRESRPDIVLWDSVISQSELAALYRSVDAFVLCSRGEGWGRPWMEAMATGLPTIGTCGSGNDDFMNEANSFLVSASLVDVTNEAAAEIPPYRGHRWLEPNRQELRSLLRRVYEGGDQVVTIANRGRVEVERDHCIAAGARAIERRLEMFEQHHSRPPVHQPGTSDIAVQLEGEFFASHSFANLNEQIATVLGKSSEVSISLRRVYGQPTRDEHFHGDSRIRHYFDRHQSQAPQITIRHAFPPNWIPPAQGKWVHIQPWEFGYLPVAWIPPLRDLVDEIWVPSQYVKRVYVQSGVPADKVVVIPWGFDEEIYTPIAPPLHLPTQKTFRFLFVGGTIERKGFDLLLGAYLDEFSRDDDVCLVIKDIGADTFYRVGTHRDRILGQLAKDDGPEIVYLDREMSDSTRASLYTACNCLAAPYRGEGFGMPILEAMACGVPAIVPIGGPTDDFIDHESAFLIEAEESPCQHDWELYRPAIQLSPDVGAIRHALRQAFTNRDLTKERGHRASKKVREGNKWSDVGSQMVARLKILAASAPRLSEQVPSLPLPLEKTQRAICAVVLLDGGLETLPNCLSRLRPFVEDIVVVCRNAPSDPLRTLVDEYGVRLMVKPVFAPGVADAQLALAWESIRCEAASRGALVLTSAVSLGEEIWSTIDEGSPESLKPVSSFPAVDTNGAAIPPHLQPQYFQAGSGTLADLNAGHKNWLEFGDRTPAESKSRHIRRPSTGAEWLAAGVVHFRAGNFFHAEAHLAEAVKLASQRTPDHLQALDLLAQCYRAIGDPYRAAECASALNEAGVAGK